MPARDGNASALEAWRGRRRRRAGLSRGQLYVEQYFPAERKVRMEALVKNLMTAYQQSIDKLDWMSPVTKKQAQIKLAKFTTKIGYPDKQMARLFRPDVKADDLGGQHPAFAPAELQP